MVKHIPNILTFGRVVLTIIFLALILQSPYTQNSSELLETAFVIFLIAGLTDVVDGPIARKLGIASKFGRMLDPLVDKILVCGAFICFAIIGQPKLFNFTPESLAIIQWFVAGVITAREVYVTILRHHAEARGINFAATMAGKIKMFVQSFAIAVVIVKVAYLQNAAWASWVTAFILITTVAVTLASATTAIRRSQPAVNDIKVNAGTR